MAIRETLELDLSRALNQLDDLERQLDSLLQPIEIPIDSDQVTLTAQEFRKVQAAIEAGVEPAQAIARATGRVEFEADQAEDAIRGLSQALDISEDEAANMVVEFQEGRVEAGRIEAAIREVSQALDLSEQDARELAQQMGRAAGETKEMAGASRGAGSGVGLLGGNLRGLITTLGAYLGAREFINFARDSINAASDLEESISKTEVVFGNFAEEIVTFSTTAPSALGLSNAAALETTATFGNLFVALGLTERAAADLAPEIVQLGADLASFNNIEVDEALVALRSGLVGEVEPLRRLGVAINAAVVEAKALELGLVDASGELSEAAKVQARYALILEQTTTAQGDFARTADGIANRQRTLAGNFENLQASIGEALLPAFEDLLAAGEDLIPLLEDLAPVFGLVGEAVVGLVEPLTLAADLLGVIVQPIKDIADAIEDTEDVDTTGFEDLSRATKELIDPTDSVLSLLDELGTFLDTGFDTATIRGAFESLNDLVAAGVSPVEALEVAYGQLAEQGTVTSEVLRGLAEVAGATDDELASFLAQQLITAEGLGTTEVEALRDLLDEVIQRLGIARGEGLNFDRSGRGRDQLDDINQAIQDTIELRAELGLERGLGLFDESTLLSEAEALGRLQAAAEAAGVSTFQFIEDAANVPPELQRSVDALSAGTVAYLAQVDAIEAFGAELEGLPGVMSAAKEALRDEEGEIVEDLAEFLANLNEELEAREAFELNLAQLRILGLGDLAQVFDDAGIEFAGLLAQVIADPASAAAAEAALDGQGRNLAQSQIDGFIEGILSGETEVTDQLIQSIIDAAAAADTPDVRAALATLARNLRLEIPVGIGQIETGFGSVPAVTGLQGSVTNNEIIINQGPSEDPGTTATRTAQAVSSVIGGPQ